MDQKEAYIMFPVNFTIKNAKGTVQGFSKVPDLEALINYSSDAINEMYPALKIPANSLTLDDGIILGLKGKRRKVNTLLVP